MTLIKYTILYYIRYKTYSKFSLLLAAGFINFEGYENLLYLSYLLLICDHFYFNEKNYKYWDSRLNYLTNTSALKLMIAINVSNFIFIMLTFFVFVTLQKWQNSDFILTPNTLTFTLYLLLSLSIGNACSIFLKTIKVYSKITFFICFSFLLGLTTYLLS